MGQFIFFTLLIMALIAGAYNYYAPLRQPIHPMAFMMDKSGYNSIETLNQKKIQQFNVTTNAGIVEIRQKMDELALQQSEFLNTVQDQQQVLKDAGKDVSKLMLEAQQKGAGDKDILQLKSLASQMQDEHRLLVDHGQDLLVLNDRLTQSRQWISDQIDLANINNENAVNDLSEHYDTLKDQSTQFFNAVTQLNQESNDQMDKIQQQVQQLSQNTADDNAVNSSKIKERVQQMMDHEHDDMLKLSENEQRNKQLLEDAQENYDNAKQQLNDKMQQAQDLMQEEAQKSEDQKDQNQQHIADEMQHIQDQQNR